MFISRWSSTIHFSPLPHFRYAYSVLLQFLAFWYSHGWMLSCLRMALVVLVCWFLVTKSIKIGFRTGQKLMMALMKDDVFIGGWYYLNMIAMWWMGIVYKACSVYKCHDENQLYGILVLEESYFMINYGGGIKWLVCFSEVRDH